MPVAKGFVAKVAPVAKVDSAHKVPISAKKVASVKKVPDHQDHLQPYTITPKRCPRGQYLLKIRKLFNLII